jgi:hypothetical protein
MRSILGFCVIASAATLGWAGESISFAQQTVTQPPAVSSSVPNIQAPGASAVTNPSFAVQQSTATMPAGTTAGTTYSGNSVVAQPGSTATVPSSGMTYYYYYPPGNTGTMYRTSAPGTYYYYTTSSTPVYSNTSQTYYSPVRRGFPFGMFRRRFVQPMMPTYTTAAATTTPTYYYTSPGYYYTPTTYYTLPGTTAPSGTFTNGVIGPGTASGTAAPVYSPTTYTVPNENLPAGATPSATVPSGALNPSRTIPTPPAVNPR